MKKLLILLSLLFISIFTFTMPQMSKNQARYYWVEPGNAGRFTGDTSNTLEACYNGTPIASWDDVEYHVNVRYYTSCTLAETGTVKNVIVYAFSGESKPKTNSTRKKTIWFVDYDNDYPIASRIYRLEDEKGNLYNVIFQFGKWKDVK